MFKKCSSIFLIILLLISPCEAYSARSYALVEMKTGRMLAGGNTEQRLPMASTTKIMTGLLACESGKMDEVYTVPKEAIMVEGSSMGLQPDEKITLRDLTYGLLLESGNDAAGAIAYCLAGSIPDFAAMMNRRAEELKLKNTHFDNPSGLDSKEHYTTALDLARLGAYAMQNPEFAKIASTVKAQVTYNGIANGRTLYNHNALLKSYEGAIGIKTGYTKKSGRCLVSCARRDGITLIAATLHGWEDWDDHKALLNYGFGLLKSTRLMNDCPQLSEAVVGGKLESLKCSYKADITAGLKADEIGRVKTQIELPRFVYAPVAKGQKIGRILFTLDGAPLEQTDIVASEGVEIFIKPKPKNFFERFFGIK